MNSGLPTGTFPRKYGICEFGPENTSPNFVLDFATFPGFFSSFRFFPENARFDRFKRDTVSVGTGFSLSCFHP
jgi:hypothetical protein